MIPKPSSQTISLTDGREITIETGKPAIKTNKIYKNGKYSNYTFSGSCFN
jgi:hypothetical protein